MSSAVSTAATTTGGVDPVTYEVIRHKLWSINSEGATTVEHVSGSPVVHATDYNFGIYTATGEMAIIGVYLLTPLYTGAMAVQEFLARYSDIEPGDVFIINDPYLAAMHQNDVQFCSPVFRDGEIVSWLGCMAHQVDLGGMDPGSWCTTATDVFQEGIRIPPGRIVRKGVVNQELWDTIVLNSRMHDTVANDFRAFLAGLRVAEQRFGELCDRYGTDAVRATMERTLDNSEADLRAMLRELPDGTYEHTSYLDRPDGSGRPGDAGVELLRVPCVMTKTDDRLVFDFSGASPQSPAYGMTTRGGLLGAVATLMLCTFGGEIPWNHGIMRPVEVVAPDGLCVTAVEPMPVSGGAAGANWTATCSAGGAIAKMLSFSERYEGFAFGPSDGSWQLSQFGGIDQHGEPFASMYMDSLLWGGPAFSFRDGVDSGGAMVILGGGATDVEQQEMRHPLLYLWRRQVPDSGGAGTHRGGNGVQFALTPIDTEEVTGVLGTHGVALPNRTGLFGGLPGSCARFERVIGSGVLDHLASGRGVDNLRELDGDHGVLPGVAPAARIAHGDVFECTVQNGGGYGDPLLRDPAAVAADVAAAAVGVEAAHRLYGVVLTDGGQVDPAATEARRDAVRAGRRERMTAPGGGAAPEVAGEPDGRWGTSLLIWTTGGRSVAACAHCRTPLGDLAGGWESLAGRITLGPEDLGGRVDVHDALTAVAHVCPHCLTALWVDTEPTSGKDWRDFALA
ncbi:hydantoinase B/oxoprolinase family protein [Actinomycetospora termitidis]|uniref:Hydantoinase B/oxoprolinase family protein n=1 Tax=Actinomycetospora termitidis TaxID=3053470 RepID=A0ABT7MB74_9PSEU|nr:hydantoinase B/oxoprolinase family protein [Actinomycetospora sp. Odt1-22]MDL5157691.1 hydantoinase B/oxoprolinase family protein [Actinomycetospora sp. Odt1-22]